MSSNKATSPNPFKYYLSQVTKLSNLRIYGGHSYSNYHNDRNGQKQLGKEVYFNLHSIVSASLRVKQSRELEAETEADTMEKYYSWLVFPVFLSLPSYTAEDLLPRNSTYPHPASVRKMFSGLPTGQPVGGNFSIYTSPSPGESSLCRIDRLH